MAEVVEEAPVAEAVGDGPAVAPLSREFVRVFRRRLLIVPGILAAILLWGPPLRDWALDRPWRYGRCYTSAYGSLYKVHAPVVALSGLGACFMAGVVAIQAWRRRLLWVVWVFGFTALLYNPFWTVHLDGEAWQVLALFVGALLLAGGFIRTDSDNSGRG